MIQGCLLEAFLCSGDLSESEWRILKDLLPIEPESRGRGRPPEQNRLTINGILWRLRCGAPWRDIPTKYGSWNTLYLRFRRWSEAGIWEAVPVTLAEIMAVSGRYSIDSTACAPTSWQPTEKGGGDRRAVGSSRGRSTSKLQCLADALGRPIAFHLTVDEAAYCKAYDVLIDLPEPAMDVLLADKGYDADAIRADLTERKIKAVIPG